MLVSAALLASAGSLTSQKNAIVIKDVYRDSTDLLREDMLVTYGYYGNEADSYVAGILDQIEDDDPMEADKWDMIMDMWAGLYDGTDVNYDLLPSNLSDTDRMCIVVLGFQLNPDGSMRDELIHRLEVALACAEQYPDAYIACTGGGTAANNEDATEAGRMADWLISHGLESDRVIVEDRSQTTAQNAIFTLGILSREYPQVDRIAIVSSDYHIATADILFEAESILIARDSGNIPFDVVSNAAYEARIMSLIISRMTKNAANTRKKPPIPYKISLKSI